MEFLAKFDGYHKCGISALAFASGGEWVLSSGPDDSPALALWSLNSSNTILVSTSSVPNKVCDKFIKINYEDIWYCGLTHSKQNSNGWHFSYWFLETTRQFTLL